MSHRTEAIRNIALAGHAGAGKTTLLEALLHAGGAIQTAGTIERGNTVSDFDPMEKQRGHSIQASLVSIDHGDQRFLLFRLPAEKWHGPCVTPAMAWINTPQPGAVAAGVLDVQGWAFKDGAGLAGVDVLVDGKLAANADYGADYDVTRFWKISTDPNHPKVGFSARVDAAGLKPGRHWLGLRLRGADGSVETWSEQAFEVPAH